MFTIELSEAEGQYLLGLCRRDFVSLEKRINRGRRTGNEEIPNRLLSDSNIAGSLQGSLESLLGLVPHIRAAYALPLEEEASL
jgi:hypothetical protein